MPSLALDIGNTRTKLGLFRENKPVEQAIWTQWALEDLTAFGKQAGVDCMIVSSVAEVDEVLVEGLREEFKVLELTHQTPLPFRNDYKTPQTLGKDRIAAVAGAQVLYPGENCLIIDCGTCIKYDLLKAEGIYPGGNIAPGATMRIKAMHHFTARLPEVDRVMPDDFIGSSTETALQNGALRGAVLEMEGFVHLFRQKTGTLRVILSGGDADFFYPHLNITDMVLEPELVLIGLNNILTFNNQ